MNKINLLNKTIIAVITMLAMVDVIAQDNAAGSGAAVLSIEEVLVTARKRSTAESVQDVPLAITAYSGEQLASLLVTKLTDLSHAMPNVQLEEVGTFPGVQNFSIRGQGINSSIPSVDPTVGVFVDGVYLGVTYGAVVDTFDLETVEVLRGPQGLLFGRNVTGGAVVLRTARPDGEFDYKARVQVTDHKQYNFAGTVEGALIEDQLAAKLAIYYDNDPGYFDSNTTGQTPGAFYFIPESGGKTGAMETTVIRPSFVFQPTAALEMTLIVERGESKGDGPVWAAASLQRAGLEKEFTTSKDEKGETDLSWYQLTFENNLDVALGDGTITNILGWRQVKITPSADIDGRSLAVFSVSGGTEQDQISNELRYSGTFLADKLDLTTGLYYFTQDVEYQENRYIRGGSILRALGGDMDHKTWGAFISSDYHLSDHVIFTAGLRYTKEKKKSNVITGACTAVVSFNCTYDALNGKWSNLTPKLGLSYEFNDNAQVYAFWTKGFRSGGVNFRNAKPNVINPGPTNEEKQNSYEAGLKSDFLDGRLRLNAAYFYNTIDDIQRELNQADADVVVLQGTINAGNVTIQGMEIDFIALLNKHFSINGSLGYLHGKYKSKTAAASAFLPGSTTMSVVGDELPRLSPWTANLGFNYRIHLGTIGSLSLHSNFAFRDRAAYNDSNTEIFDKQYDINASLSYLSADEHWNVALYGKNLSDEARWGNLTSISGLWTAGPMQKGRVLGLEISYSH